MGYIKEPKGIDLIVSPMPLSSEDREAISTIIKTYKLTGEIPNKNKPFEKKGKKKAQNTEGPLQNKTAHFPKIANHFYVVIN
jgi:hypothetical protein